MNISGLLRWLDALPAVRSLLEDLDAGDSASPLGLLRSARPALLATLSSHLDQPILVVTGSVERARVLYQSLRDWYPDAEQVLRFPEPPALFYERVPWPNEIVARRMAILCRWALPRKESPHWLIVASARALMQPLLPVEEFHHQTVTVQTGQQLGVESTARHWSGLGYQPASVVEGPGQFSHRGGIMDIYPPAEPLPVRIELFGDQVESIRRFDPATQRSQARLEIVRVTPAREVLSFQGPGVARQLAPWFDLSHPQEVAGELATQREALAAGVPFPGLEFYQPYFCDQPASLAEYLPAGGLLVVDDLVELADEWAGFEEEAVRLQDAAEREGMLPPGYLLPYVTWDDWRAELDRRSPLVLGHGEGEIGGELSTCFHPERRYGGQLSNVLDDIDDKLSRRQQVVVVSRQARRLAELWADEREAVIPVGEVTALPQVPLTFVKGALEEGWSLASGEIEPSGAALPYSRLVLLTDGEIFGWRMPEPRRPKRRRRAAPESLYADLTAGDIVVHVDYGIGVFRGLSSYTLAGEEREYLLVEYAAQDQLYVPIYQADRISRYVGADDQSPQLSRLGAAEWAQVKARTRQAVEQVAKDLLDLYAARELAPGHAFAPDTRWQAELEAAFPYAETPDQEKAIVEVKSDMERTRPMDRLVCGDVGYGKTEVALRAAFKAVMDGKQVAILVPTTVLAQQHYTTFRHRLASFPVVVEMLSRFRTRADQARVLEGLHSGSVDVVIGTHRLLQKDVVLKDLGLVIIDEEQRFGVTHKERLKQMRTEVDVLTMTATPIPRTLYLSLAGVRDISVIETPPEERLPVSTYVGPYDPQVARRTILRELERAGQVFYVHNRVQTIDAVRQRLENLVPEAAIAVAHGQMRERDLEVAMLRFVAGEVDVLLCTSIIESGLDIPNANTLVVEQAERFGLAQLYQLRGRVGRAARRANACFFYSPGRLTTDARQRLETIRETGDLGAGYSIAMRDLELRGAGDVLGVRQSGHISAIGFDLYTRLLARAVEELRASREGRPVPPEPLSGIRIDLPLPVGLPPDYVPDTSLRLRLYRRLANLGDLAQIGEMEAELEDRFGPLPETAVNMLLQLRFKVRARDAGVRTILVEAGRLVLYADWLDGPDRMRMQTELQGLAHVSQRKVGLAMEDDWQEELQAVLERLGQGRVVDRC